MQQIVHFPSQNPINVSRNHMAKHILGQTTPSVQLWGHAILIHFPSRFKGNTREVSIEGGRGQTYVSLHQKIRSYYTCDCTYKHIWLHISSHTVKYEILGVMKWLIVRKTHVLHLPNHIFALWMTSNDIKAYIYRFLSLHQQIHKNSHIFTSINSQKCICQCIASITPTYVRTYVDVVSEHM